jgi:NADH-quinone oxidoreductase subunit J
MAWVIFSILSVSCIGAVTGMIVTRKQAHGALFLVLAFSSLGGIFGLLDAPFAAAAQVLVYAGAIMVLFLFAIMMFNLLEAERRSGKRLRIALATGLAVILLVELILAGRRALEGSHGKSPLTGGGDIAHLGRLLFSDYLYAFEITSLLILAALVGALALAGRKGDE